jgi:hypothetical protein
MFIYAKDAELIFGVQLIRGVSLTGRAFVQEQGAATASPPCGPQSLTRQPPVPPSPI